MFFSGAYVMSSGYQISEPWVDCTFLSKMGGYHGAGISERAVSMSVFVRLSTKLHRFTVVAICLSLPALPSANRLVGFGLTIE